MRKIIILLSFVVLSFIIGLSLGSEFFSPFKIFLIPRLKETERIIILNLRLPRVVAGFFTGAGLAITGTVLQALLKNPLAESYTLGISGGASLGICIGVILGSYLGIPLFGFLGGIISTVIIVVAGSKKKLSNPALILLGVILNFIFTSFVLFLLAISGSEKFQQTFFWLIGDLSYFPHLLFKPVIFLISGVSLLLFTFSKILDLISIGEEKARTLGVETERMKKILFILSSIITGCCVSLGGMIGFVGLIIPHITRIFFGSGHFKVLPVSFLLGGSFLILSDGIARSIISPLEIPVGVITGFFGGLFFLFLLLRSKKGVLI